MRISIQAQDGPERSGLSPVFKSEVLFMEMPIVQHTTQNRSGIE